jgi:hypothetical protein
VSTEQQRRYGRREVVLLADLLMRLLAKPRDEDDTAE